MYRYENFHSSVYAKTPITIVCSIKVSYIHENRFPILLTNTRYFWRTIVEILVLVWLVAVTLRPRTHARTHALAHTERREWKEKGSKKENRFLVVTARALWSPRRDSLVLMFASRRAHVKSFAPSASRALEGVRHSVPPGGQSSELTKWAALVRMRSTEITRWLSELRTHEKYNVAGEEKKWVKKETRSYGSSVRARLRECTSVAGVTYSEL